MVLVTVSMESGKVQMVELVKVLYNGHEAMLPLPEAAPSFYPWSAFKDFYGKLISETK